MADNYRQTENGAEVISNLENAGNSTTCESCKNLESQLSHVLNELLSVRLIVDLLIKESNKVQNRMEEGRGVHKVLVRKPEGKRPLGRPRRIWEDNIKIDLREMGRGCGDWMELAQDRERWRALVSTVMNFWVP